MPVVRPPHSRNRWVNLRLCRRTTHPKAAFGRNQSRRRDGWSRAETQKVQVLHALCAFSPALATSSHSAEKPRDKTLPRLSPCARVKDPARPRVTGITGPRCREPGHRYAASRVGGILHTGRQCVSGRRLRFYSGDAARNCSCSSEFTRRTSTVARPMGVFPTTSRPCLSKCSDQMWRRGWNSSVSTPLAGS
jgi:hypothetical protein